MIAADAAVDAAASSMTVVFLSSNDWIVFALNSVEEVNRAITKNDSNAITIGISANKIFFCFSFSMYVCSFILQLHRTGIPVLSAKIPYIFAKIYKKVYPLF